MRLRVEPWIKETLTLAAVSLPITLFRRVTGRPVSTLCGSSGRSWEPASIGNLRAGGAYTAGAASRQPSTPSLKSVTVDEPSGMADAIL